MPSLSYDNSKIINVYIGDNLTTIESDTFENCKSLENVRFIDQESATLTTIGSNAFSGCSNLKELYIPSKVTSLGYCAFMDCDKLQNVTIDSEKIINLEEDDSCLYIYQEDNYRQYIKIDSSVTPNANSIIELNYYHKSNETNYKKYKAVSNLPSYFRNFCTDENKIYLGNSKYKCPDNIVIEPYYKDTDCEEPHGIIKMPVTCIYRSGFWGCDTIKSVIFENGIDSQLISINDQAFSSNLGGVMDIETIQLNNNLETIGASVFQGNVNLKEISIPSSVKKIGDGAFNLCISLGKINFLDTTHTTWNIVNSETHEVQTTIDVSTKTPEELANLIVADPTYRGNVWQKV